MKKYYIFFDRSQKIENFFIVTDSLLPRQEPLIVSENKDEIECICKHLNDVLQSRMKTMVDDKDFFLK